MKIIYDLVGYLMVYSWCYWTRDLLAYAHQSPIKHEQKCAAMKKNGLLVEEMES